MNRAEASGLPREAIEKMIDSWIFNIKHREILKRRLLDGICYEPLAAEFDMSVRQIKKIVYQAEDRLFSHTLW